MLSLNKNYLFILGTLVAMPLFLVVGGSGFSMPTTYYEVEGVPIHFNFLILLLFPFFYIRKIKVILIVLFSAAYITIGLIEGGDRALLFLQQMHFFLIYACLKNLSPQKLIYVVKGFLVSLILLVSSHLASIIYSLFSGNIFSAGPYIFDFVIYQAYLTYPLVLVIGFYIALQYFGLKSIWGIFLLFGIFFVEIILMRRVAVMLFLLVTFLFYYKYFYILLALIFVSLGYIAGELLEVFTNSFDRVTSLTDSTGFTRSMTWNRSLGYLTDIKILLFGNGIHNHSHNFFLHSLTTNGVIVSSILFYFYFSLFKKFFKNINYSIKPMIFISALILIDWNLNVNIYQHYYSGSLALLMIYLSNEKKFS